MRDYRERKKRITQGKDNAQGITQDGTYFKDGIEMVPASYVEGKDGKIYEFLPERPRHLTLSDGQALDRAAQPSSILGGIRMRRCNEAGFNFKILKGSIPNNLKGMMTKSK